MCWPAHTHPSVLLWQIQWRVRADPSTDNVCPGPRKPANVVGTLCENNDWFAKQRDLPEADVGSVFVIHDTGAHSHSMGFQVRDGGSCLHS